MASTQLDILNAVQAAIAALSLVDMEEVAVRAEPQDGKTFYHGITVSPTGEHELRGTNERDDFSYKILITCAVNNDVDPTEDDLFGTWRQRIRKEFLHQKLPGVTSVITCQIEPGPLYANTPEHLDISTFVLHFVSRETRG